MSGRAPSLEILEHTVAARRHGEAFGEALAILRAIDARYGRVDMIAWKPSPVCVGEEDRLIEFATRFCAALGDLVVDRAFDPTLEQFIDFAGVRRWVDVLFRVGAFGSSDHLLEIIGRGSSGEPWCFEGSACARFLMVWSPDTTFRIEPSEWLAGQPALAAPTWLAHLGARFHPTPSGAAFRGELLALMAARADAWSLAPRALAAAGEAYLHCSYAALADKHAIKRALIDKTRRLLLDAGCVEWTPSTPWPARERPLIVVTTEFFAEGHSVHRTHARAIRGLRERFQVVGFLRADQRGAASDDCFDEVVEYPVGDFIDVVSATAKAILARAPDIVLHAGVGLSARVMALAALRLAPVQCASHGHAATTMSPAIDHFLLPADFVGDPGAFSETLPVLPPAAFPYTPRRETAPPPVARAQGPVRVAIPGSLPKLNPDLFAALGEIARGARTAVVFEFFPLGAAGLAHLDLARALRACLPNAVVHAEMAHAAYLAALAACDFFLCPFPYGNMNSILDALSVGLPGVCLDGREPHAHADAALFARAGLPGELTAGDVDAYVAAATRLLDDADFRAALRAHVAALDLDARLYAGDDGLLGRALTGLLDGSFDPARAES